MCGRKKRYREEGFAKRVARLRQGAGAPPLRAYPCAVCRGWHLTSGEELGPR